MRFLFMMVIMTSLISPGFSQDNHSSAYEALTASEESYLTKNEDLPIIQRFYKQVKRRCQIHFSADILAVQNEIFSTCEKETKFNYRRQYDVTYAAYDTLNYYNISRDNCWHHCVLERLYEKTGRTKEALKLTTNSTKEILRIFSPEMSHVMKYFVVPKFKQCRNDALRFLETEKEFIKTKWGITLTDDSDKRYPCYLAQLHWFCLNEHIRRATVDDESVGDLRIHNHHLRRCIKEIDQSEIDSEGPSFEE